MKAIKIRIFRILFIVFLFLLINNTLWSQTDKKRLAVLPFVPIETSDNEAKVITSLFETALVNTEVYNIIEQNRINEILEVQTFSLLGCTDDTCAIEVGKILSAEFIVLGEFSRIGSNYIATAKIIDVTLGSTVKADSITASSIEEMTGNSIRLLSYKLVGITYSETVKETIIGKFGNLFVNTIPQNAEVFINGVSRGFSPLLIENVPFGTLIVDARKDNLVGGIEENIASIDLKEIEIPLEPALGNIFITSTENDVTIFIDGVKIGLLGNGLFKDIVVGIHILELKGDGLYFSKEINVEENKVITIDASLELVGKLKYELQEGVIGEVIGKKRSLSISGYGIEILPIGEYSILLDGEKYIQKKEIVAIDRGCILLFKPELQYSEEYSQVLFDQQRTSEWERLNTVLNNLHEKISIKTSGKSEYLNEIEELRKVCTEIDNSIYDFNDLYKKAHEILVSAIQYRIIELNSLVLEFKKKQRMQNTGRWLSFGFGAVGYIISAICKFAGDSEYDRYLIAQTTAEANYSHELLNCYAAGQTAGLLLGGVCTIGGIIIPWKNETIELYNEEIDSLSSELASLSVEF